MKCSKCGNKNDPDDDFCAKCGKPLTKKKEKELHKEISKGIIQAGIIIIVNLFFFSFMSILIIFLLIINEKVWAIIVLLITITAVLIKRYRNNRG